MKKIIELKDFSENEEAALDFILLTLFADQMEYGFQKSRIKKCIQPSSPGKGPGRRYGFVSNQELNIAYGRGTFSSGNIGGNTAEDYLPLLFLLVPKTMKKKYPDEMKDILSREKELSDEFSYLESIVPDTIASYSKRPDVIVNNTRHTIGSSTYKFFEPLRRTSRIMLGRLSGGKLPIDTSRISDFVTNATEQNGGSFSEFIQKMDDTENELWTQLLDTIKGK